MTTVYSDLQKIFDIQPKANIANLHCAVPSEFKAFVGAGRAFGCYPNPTGHVPEDMLFIQANWSQVKYNRQQFQMVLCLEDDRLDMATKMLANEGFLVVICFNISEKNWLSYRRNYAQFSVYSYTDKMFIVIAKRKTHLDIDYESRVDEYKAEYANHDRNYLHISKAIERHVVRAGKRIPEFYLDGDLPDITEQVQKNFTYGKPSHNTGIAQPLMPASLGHLIQFIGMGGLDNTPLTLGNETYILRGSTVKVETSKGKSNVPQFVIMDSKGNVQRLNKPMELIDFVVNNPHGLRDALVNAMKPQFDMQIEPEWGNVFDTIRVNGEELLKTQELAISAMVERLLRARHGFLLESPSCGKTVQTITIMYILHQFGLYKKQYPALVESICNRYGVKAKDLKGLKAGSVNLVYVPAILPQQWMREFESVLGNDVCVRTVSKPSELRWLSEEAKSNPKVLHVAIITYEALKLSDGIENAYNQRHELTNTAKKKAFRNTDGIIRYVADPITGNHLRDHNGDRITVKSVEGKTRKRFFKGQYSNGEYIGLERRKDGRGGYEKRGRNFIYDPVTRPITRQHGHALWQMKRRKTNVVRGNDGEAVLGGNVLKRKGVTVIKPYKLALADVIKRLKNVGMVVVDEAHRIKSGDSIAGVAVRRTFAKAQKIMLVTATFSSGTAESFFHLVYPLSRELRNKYPYRGELVFAKDFGNITDTGKVLAGIAPEALRFIIDATVFVDIPDLGNAMPDFHETVVPVGMTLKQKELYERMTKEITDYGTVCDDMVVWALLWQAQSTLLDQCHLPEIHYHHRRRMHNGEMEVKRTFTYEGFVGEVTPKEEAMADLVMETIGRGERAIVFTTQSDTRSILDKLAGVVRDAGANPFILKASTEPDKRHDYITQHVKAGYNVMIANPKLCAEGVSLVDFTDIIFFDVDTSTTVMVQASRRTWRITQKSPLVKVYYLAYDNTTQLQRVYNIARRSAAMRALQGILATDFDVEYADSEGYGALGRAFAKAVSASDVNKAFEDGKSMFGYEMSVFNTPHNRKNYKKHRMIVVDDIVDSEDEV